jgi:glycosyltransferase involved in cell wall biosynthesis
MLTRGPNSLGAMWNGERVSVVLMTYAERFSIRGVIDGFYATGVVDEVIVVDNNAQPGTKEEVAHTQARLVHEPRQGYGHASRRGLAEAGGDLVVLTEPDGTFLPEDIFKLLVYSRDCDAVFGTRTTPQFVWSGANMAWFLRWGNWGVAKLVEVLFNTRHLSDVGCTYRLLRRGLAQRVAADMTVGGSHAGAEIMLLAILSGARFVEIPVNYLPRVGTSSVTGKPLEAIVVGLRMILLVLRFRSRAPRRLPRPSPFVIEREPTDQEAHEQLPL